MVWDISQLSEGFVRNIIGFDLRDISINFDYSSRNIFSYIDINNRFPATIDNQVWPESANKYEINSQCNGFNLFDQLDVEIRRAAHATKSAIVAFDIPIELAKSLSPTFGLIPLPIELLSLEQTWSFLGYDIVDIRTQNSAVYSFNWTNHETEEIIRKSSLKLNGYGLIQSDLDALLVSSIFDKMIPEHSPFAPCGVWLCVSEGGTMGRSALDSLS